MGDSGIAIILYTVREPAQWDLADTLKRVRDTGFEFVQWSGMPDLPPERIRDLLEAAGLQAIAGHCAIEPFETDFDGALGHWRTIGVTDLAPGGMMADCRDSLAAWRRGAKRLESVGVRLREAGLRLSYHNHDFEFERFAEDPRRKLDILYAETDPDALYAELDTAWVSIGGADPAEYLRRYSGRCPIIHVKDHKVERDAEGRPIFTELGKGVLDWPAVLEAARVAEVQWLVYEQDTAERDVFESCAVSYEFLSRSIQGGIRA